MFETARLESYQLEFMQALGHSVTITPAWPHFQGQLVAGAKAYYTVLDGGWEIVFHVAPLLSADERRQVRVYISLYDKFLELTLCV